jgi:hypothetical protein
VVLAFLALAPPAAAAGRQLLNQWEIHNELQLPPDAAAAVPEVFPSFLEYQDLIMFHPKSGTTQRARAVRRGLPDLPDRCWLRISAA